MKYILIIFLFLSFKISAQKNKIIYVNEQKQEIDKLEFQKLKKTDEYWDIYFQQDSLDIYLLVKRNTKGKISKNQLNQLKENLSIKEITTNTIIVIIYYPGKDKCNATKKTSSWNIFDKNYLKKLNKISKISHHWVYKDSEDLKYFYKKKIDWKKDTNQFLEKLFFKYKFPCSSSVLIDANGNYITIYGEFGKQNVLQIAQELKSINQKN